MSDERMIAIGYAELPGACAWACRTFEQSLAGMWALVSDEMVKQEGGYRLLGSGDGVSIGISPRSVPEDLAPWPSGRVFCAGWEFRWRLDEGDGSGLWLGDISAGGDHLATELWPDLTAEQRTEKFIPLAELERLAEQDSRSEISYRLLAANDGAHVGAGRALSRLDRAPVAILARRWVRADGTLAFERFIGVEDEVEGGPEHAR